MNRDLGILKIACSSLIPLKYNENLYKRASVILASDTLLKAAGYEPMHKDAGMLGTGLLTAGALALGAILSSKGGKMYENTMLGLNGINSDWGQGAVIARANRGDMTPAERDRYLMRHLSERNYNAARDWADNSMYAQAEAAKREYMRRNAAARGGRIINNAYGSADRSYAYTMSGFPGYTYGYTSRYSRPTSL